MQDYMILAAAKKGIEFAKQSFLSDYQSFLLNYLYEISGMNSAQLSEIIDTVFDKCYKDGIFFKATSSYSYGTLFLMELRKYLLENPSVLPMDNNTGSDIFSDYTTYLSSGGKVNDTKGESRYISLNDKTSRYLFAARYFYFLNPKKIQQKLQISEDKYNQLISKFHSFKTTDYDCCSAADFIEPELLEFFNQDCFSEYQVPSDIVPHFPLTDNQMSHIRNRKLMSMQTDANIFTLKYIFPVLLLLGIGIIVFLKFFMN